MEEQNGLLTIEGTAAVLIYQNPENGYAVLRLETEDGLVTAVGCMPGISPGEDLVLKGKWIVHPSYGEQFKAEWAQRS
ncbi:MAG: ATP-dependent RecD-like DNA helicase, partial [Oscillospiraceae bacterium]|nr:ATP-dependent RecD-like DNA helicase [Oscillospiraceae bacterium]